MNAALDRLVLRALTPLDHARALWLGVSGRYARRLLRVRTARVGWQATVLASMSLALALRAPLVLLTLGPLILGVPHLMADLRYLVVRQRLAQRTVPCVAVALCLILANVAPGQGWGVAAVSCAGLLARGSWARRAVAVTGCVVVLLAAHKLADRADVIFAHAHNLVAIGCWALWARGKRMQLLPALVICCVGCALVLAGVTDRIVFDTHALQHGSFAIDAGRLVTELSPVRDPRQALRWTICFAFMQSVHYGVWLRSLPDEDRERPGLRSFGSSYRALSRDVGPWLLVAALLLMAWLAVAASVDPAAARSGYLELARFHGPLELAVLALLWVEARLPQRAT